MVFLFDPLLALRSLVDIGASTAFSRDTFVGAYYKWLGLQLLLSLSGGLALKLILLQIVQMNVLVYLVARAFDCAFEWIHQLIGVLGGAGVSWLAQGAPLHSRAGAAAADGSERAR